MSTVPLASLDDARVAYELNVQTGAVGSTTFRRPKQADRVRVSGLAGTEKKGLWRAPRGFFGVFLFEGEQFVWLDGVIANVERDGWEFRVTSPAPGVRRFTAWRQGNEVMSFLYWRDLSRNHNILSFIVQQTRLAEARERFVASWKENLEAETWRR